VFAIREFRALWSAQTLSNAGDQFAQVAIAILVYTRTGSPFLTALAYALTYLPPIVGGPLLSGLADLFPRRRMMIVLDLIRAALVAGMVIPGMPFAGLCVLLFFTVLLAPPFSAARSALLPEVLPPGKFVAGSAVGTMTFQISQLVGFLLGAGVVAALGPHRTLALDAISFLVSAGIIARWVRPRPAPASGPLGTDDIPSADRDTTPPAEQPAPAGRPATGPEPAARHARPSLWAVTRDGAHLVFGRPVLRTLVLFGWLAGFTIVPEGLAAPYARTLGGGDLTVGMLMAAMPAGMVVGAYVIGRMARPTTRLRILGWLAMLSCAPLIVSLVHPPLWAVLVLWTVAGAGGSYHLAAAAAFVQALPPAGRARAFGIAQSGLLAVQGLGILAAGAAAQLIGPQAVVGISGLAGMTIAAALASVWSCRHAELPDAHTALSAATEPAPAADGIAGQ
jgi:MFS family permease